jgi:hypothetical protein
VVCPIGGPWCSDALATPTIWVIGVCDVMSCTSVEMKTDSVVHQLRGSWVSSPAWCGREVDTDHNRTVSFSEFMQMMSNLRSGKSASPSHPTPPPAQRSRLTPWVWCRAGGGEGGLSKVVKKAAHLMQVQGAGGAQHSYSEEEKVRKDGCGAGSKRGESRERSRSDGERSTRSVVRRRTRRASGDHVRAYRA